MLTPRITRGAVGGIFAGQGANLIPGSVMTGDPKWLYIGIAMAVIGVLLIVLGVRRGARSRD